MRRKLITGKQMASNHSGPTGTWKDNSPHLQVTSSGEEAGGTGTRMFVFGVCVCVCVLAHWHRSTTERCCRLGEAVVVDVVLRSESGLI